MYAIWMEEHAWEVKPPHEKEMWFEMANIGGQIRRTSKPELVEHDGHVRVERGGFARHHAATEGAGLHLLNPEREAAVEHA